MEFSGQNRLPTMGNAAWPHLCLDGVGTAMQ